MANRDSHLSLRATLTDPLDSVIGMVPAVALADTAQLPDVLSVVLKRLDGKVTSADVCQSLLEALPLVPAPLANALRDVAECADRSGLGNAYHNRVHSRDVAVIFANLARLQALLTNRSSIDGIVVFIAGCCAAFGHDLGHDGSSHGEPFRLEQIAANAVGATMDRHGVAEKLIQQVRCAILSTDVHGGYRALDSAGRGAVDHSHGALVDLSALADGQTRDMACLLRDADVMQSAGLTPEDHDRQTARLERELGIPEHSMGPRGADFFLKDLIQGRFLSEAGRVFQPRLDHLLQLNEMRARKGPASQGLAAFDR